MNNTANKRNVLIFEDDFTLALEWKEALKLQGIDAEHAWDVDEAIDLCNHHKFDVIICDIFIRDNNGKHTNRGGVTLVSSLRRQLKNAPEWGTDVPILVVTGVPVSLGFNVLAITESMGASATMRKPFSANQLVEKIQQSLVEVESKK